MEGEKNFFEEDLRILKDQVDEYETKKEEMVLRACSYVVEFFKRVFNIQITNFQYLRIRQVANEVVDQIILEIRNKIRDAKEKGATLKFGGLSGFNLDQETFQRFLLDEYKVSYKDLPDFENKDTEKWKAFLEKRKAQNDENPEVFE